MERKILSSLQFAFIFVLILFQSKVFAQIGTPTFVFTQMCAEPPPYTFPYNPSTSNFNEWTINFTFGSPGNYVLEMSDPNGSFLSSPLPTLTILASQTATSPGSFTFRLPNNLVGSDKYRFRVKNIATNPATAGPSSGAVPNPDPSLPGRTGISAYYKSFIKNFWINNHASTLGLCGTSSITLSIDPATPQDESPIVFPNLKYKWYTTNDVLISGQSGPTLTVNTPGDYYVMIDYGSCSPLSSVFKSQTVTVVQSPVGQTFTITSSSGTDICPSSPTTLSTQSGYSYQWFRDDVAISGATSNTYVTTVPGKYHVVVGQGSCASPSNSITLKKFTTTIDIDLDPVINIIEVDEIKNITVTNTTANSPTYEWYLIGNPTVLSTASTLTTSTPGNYKLVVTQTAGCVYSQEYFFTLKEGVKATEIPNTISPNGDLTNDTWIIPQEYISENTEIFIVDSFGKEVLKTKNYQNDWPQTNIEFKSVNPVYYYIISKDGSAVKKGSITVIK